MKFSRSYAAAATTLMVALLHIQPGTASAPASAAATGSRRRTQWWAEALGAGDVGGGGGGNDRPVPRPTNPPPTLPTGGDYLQFVDREPNFRLGRCEGDCDKDSVRSRLFGALALGTYIIALSLSHFFNFLTSSYLLLLAHFPAAHNQQECQKGLVCFEPEDRKDFAWGCIGEVDGNVSDVLARV